MELARYAEAIAGAGPLDTILTAIRPREEHRDTIMRELRALTPQRPGPQDVGEIRLTLRQYLANWTAMMRASVAEARRVLRDVLVDRIVFRPVPRPPELPPVKGPGRRARLVYEVAGEASLSKLFAELIYVSSLVVPTGFVGWWHRRSPLKFAALHSWRDDASSFCPWSRRSRRIARVRNRAGFAPLGVRQVRGIVRVA